MPVDQQPTVSAADDVAVVPDIIKEAERPPGKGLKFAKKLKCNRPDTYAP